MSVSSVSFWQQDQNWLTSQRGWSAQLSGTNLASQAMASALTSQSSGLASIFNQEALTRVTNQLQTAAASAIKSSSSNSTGSAAYTPAGTTSGILNNYSVNLASAGTASSMLSSVMSAGFSTGGLVSILT